MRLEGCRCFYSLDAVTQARRYTAFSPPRRKECFKSFRRYCTSATDLTCTQAAAPGCSPSSA